MVQPKPPLLDDAMSGRRTRRIDLSLRWLVGVTLLCVALVFGLRSFFTELDSALRDREANERARLFVGEEIVRGIQGVEKDIYRMAATQNANGFARLNTSVATMLEKIEHDLHVLQDGGTAQRALRLNVGGMDELLRSATFKPDQNEARRVMEVIEILPQLDQIRGTAVALEGLLQQRWQAVEDEDRQRFFRTEEDMAMLLKQVPPYFERLNENANRLFMEGDQRLRALETQLQSQRRRLQLFETALIALVILFGGSAGTLLMRRLTTALTDARKARVEVEGQREQSETMLATLSDGVYATDMDGCITFMNPAAERILGWQSDELVGQQAHSAIHHTRPTGEHFPPEDCPLISVMQDGSTCDGEDHFIGRDGRHIPVSYRSKPLMRAGEMVGSLLSFQDISERQESEARIRLQQAALDSAANMVVITDCDGLIEYVNPAFCSTTGYRSDEVLGQQINLFNAGVNDPLYFQSMWDTVLQGQSWEGELNNRRKDGTIYPEQTTITPILNQGRISHFVSIKRDISEEVHTRTRLKLVETAIQETEQGILITDASANASGLNIQYVNAGFSRITGFSAEEAVGEYTGILHGPETDPAQMELFAQAIAAGRAVAMEMRLRRKDREPFMAELHYSPVHDEKGKVRHYIGLLSDIGPRKEAENALRQAHDQALETSRLKSEFLSNMSHEIRTPMNGIIGMTDLLLDTALNAEQADFTGIVRDSASALLTIINDILDFSKIEAGKLDIEISDFSPAQVLEGTGDLLSARAREKSLTLSIFCDPALPPLLRGDPTRLRQVLLNLVGNAVKFTEHGSVEVNAVFAPGSEQSMVRFEVSDTGIGISREAQARLFQSFSQADSSTTRKYGGTGLGLAISKRLVELMGGAIGVVSEPDKGATFWFTLPLVQSDETLPTEPGTPILRSSFQHLRVLVVDDQASDRKVIHRYLASWGLVNDGASSAGEALKLMRDAADIGSCYDIALIDYSMPGTDGLELAHSIRQQRAFDGTRLVLLTAHDRRELFERALSLGFSACLSKPVRQSTLFDSLSAGLSGGAAPNATGRADAPASEADAVPLRLPLILLAEDNLINQKVAQLQLKKMGYAVQIANNGTEVLAAVAQGDFAAILMDCQMPLMDGFEATATLRKNALPDGRRIPIIAMTANAMQGDRERCLAAGMDDYLSKPINPDLLKAALAQWVPEVAEPARTQPATESSPLREAAPALLPSPIDFSRLDDYFSDDPDVIVTLLNAFGTSTGPVLDQLHNALKACDRQAVATLVHEIRGTCGNLGVDGMAQIAARIENAAGSGDWAHGLNLIDELQHLFTRVQRAIYERIGNR
jgi:PAS domain S-box-containing protein